MSTQPLVLVADDDRESPARAIALSEEGFRCRHRQRGGWRAGAPEGRGGRPDIVLSTSSCRPRRHRGDAPVARAPARAGDPADGEGLDRDKAKGLDSARTTTSPSHSTRTSSLRACAPSSAAPAARSRVRASSSRRRRDRSRAANGHRTASSCSCRAPSGCSSSTSRECRQGRPAHGAPDKGVGPGIPRRPPVPAGVGEPRRRSSAPPPASRAESGRFQGIGYLLDVDGATSSRLRSSPAAEVPEREATCAHRLIHLRSADPARVSIQRPGSVVLTPRLLPPGSLHAARQNDEVGPLLQRVSLAKSRSRCNRRAAKTTRFCCQGAASRQNSSFLYVTPTNADGMTARQRSGPRSDRTRHGVHVCRCIGARAAAIPCVQSVPARQSRCAHPQIARPSRWARAPSSRRSRSARR